MSLSGAFSAGHSLPNHPHCGRVHGHSYRVLVTLEGEPDPDQSGLVADEAAARSLLTQSLAELDARNLNDMLAPALPSVQGVASWLWERFALHYKLDEVTVWQDDLAASVRR